MSASTVRLSEITSALESGGRPKGGAGDIVSGVLSLGGEHVSADGSLNLGPKRFVPFDYYEEMRRGRLKRGDILIVKDGATTGKVGFVDSSIPLPAAVNEHVFRLEVNETIADQRYVFYHLLSPLGNQQILRDFRGATVGGISQDFVEFVELPLPDLSEQKRLGWLLEEADRLRRTRRYTLELSATVLSAAFLQLFGDNFHRGQFDQLGSLVKITGGGTPSRDRPGFFKGRIPWLTSKDMRGDYIWDTEEHITEDAIKNSATKLVPATSILIVVKSKVLMHRLPVAIAKVPMCHGQDIKSIQCSKTMHYEFARFVLKYHERRLLNIARGANTEGLTLPMLEELPVPRVDHNAQRKFAVIVERHERLRGVQREALRQADHLFQSLLERAFR